MLDFCFFRGCYHSRHSDRKKRKEKKKKHNCKLSQSPHSSFLFGFFKILKSSVEFAGEGSWMDTFGLYIVGTGGCALCTFDYFIRSKAF